MARWQGRLEHQQGFLGRMVDIGAELFAMSAAVRRAPRCWPSRTPSRRGRPSELADVFCRQARLRAERLFDALWANTDSVDVALAREVLDGAYTWVEEGIVDQSGDGPWIADATPGESRSENVARRFLRAPADACPAGVHPGSFCTSLPRPRLPS